MMIMWVIVAALFIGGILGFSACAVLAVNQYDKGFEDGKT
jgi:hypothetical protein